MASEEYRKSIPIHMRTQVYLDRLKEDEEKVVTPMEKAGDRIKGVGVGYKALDLFDKYNESISTKLNLVDKTFEIGTDPNTGGKITEELFRTATPFKGNNFAESMLGEKLRSAGERIEIIPGMEQEATMVLKDKVLAGEMSETEMFQVMEKGSSTPIAFDKASKVLNSTAVSRGIPGVMAAADFAEGDVQGGAHNVGRMFYKELAAAGPYGWGAIALNELMDLFS